METKKQLYPLKFIPIASRRVWGGSDLINKLDKEFVEVDDDGNEASLTTNDKIGESWELADMGFEDSVVAEGWLAGNTIGELMETYMERIVGEDIYQYYGRQFPLLIKFLDIKDKLSVQVHPDDEIAEQRYDALGKSEIWYVLEAAPDSKVYMGFNREVSAQELYDRCHNGTVEEILNVIYPKKGDVIHIKPGTVHAADGGLLIAEIQESSDLTFRLYDWGREFNPKTARQMHLEEAIDLINYSRFDESQYIKGPLWKDNHGHCCCGHDGEHEGHHHHEDEVVRKLVQTREFTVNELKVSDPLHIYTEKFGRFIIYICIEGEVSIQVPSQDEKGGNKMDNWYLKKGETILIPADMPDFFIVPVDRGSRLLEAMVEKFEEEDGYIDPDTNPYLDGEDYDGVEDGYDEDGCGDAGCHCHDGHHHDGECHCHEDGGHSCGCGHHHHKD
ncbi:MAG: class I mannose-6-phosphate isomerase [Bacteroidales bacterium]|nr:class I mannose-6-phosphate isomerase [Bacteroidales bacterium]